MNKGIIIDFYGACCIVEYSDDLFAIVFCEDKHQIGEPVAFLDEYRVKQDYITESCNFYYFRVYAP